MSKSLCSVRLASVISNELTVSVSVVESLHSRVGKKKSYLQADIQYVESDMCMRLYFFLGQDCACVCLASVVISWVWPTHDMPVECR